VNTRFVALCVFLAVATVPPIWAGELAGVTLDDTVTLNDADLVLNGMGLRKKLWVEVYVAGLYLPSKTSDPGTVVSSAGAKKMVMHFLTDKAKKKKMASAWREGFEGNARDYAAIEARVDTFIGYFGDMKDGDVVEMDLVPGQGTTVYLNGTKKGTIEGDDFAAELLRVWVGEVPPSDDFKAGVLGA
jgi:hypothetical protein